MIKIKKKRKEIPLSRTKMLMYSLIHNFNNDVAYPLLEWMENEICEAYPDYEKLSVSKIVFKEPSINPNGHILDNVLTNANTTILNSKKSASNGGIVVSVKDNDLYIIEFSDKEFYATKYGYRYYVNINGMEEKRPLFRVEYRNSNYCDFYNKICYFYLSCMALAFAKIINHHYGKDITYDMIKFFQLFNDGFKVDAYEFEGNPKINRWRNKFKNLQNIYPILYEVYIISDYLKSLNSYIKDYFYDPNLALDFSKLYNCIGNEVIALIVKFIKEVMPDIYEDIYEFDSIEEDIGIYNPYYSMTHFRKRIRLNIDDVFGKFIHIRVNGTNIYEILYNHKLFYETYNDEHISLDDMYLSVFFHEYYHYRVEHDYADLDINILQNKLLNAMNVDVKDIEEEMQNIKAITSNSTSSLENVNKDEEYHAEVFSMVCRMYLTSIYKEQYAKFAYDVDSAVKKWNNLLK